MKKNKVFILYILASNIILMLLYYFFKYINLNSIVSNIILITISLVFFFYIGLTKCRKMHERFLNTFSTIEFIISQIIYFLFYYAEIIPIKTAEFMSWIISGTAKPITSLILIMALHPIL